jgi:sugar/nucleoside kinase (ribokinase family)
MQIKTPTIQIREADLVCIGSVVADLIFLGINTLPQIGKLVVAEGMEFHPGGCATNTSLAFAKLGGKVRLIARVGEDSIGENVLQQLKQYGILTDNVLVTPALTAVTIALISPSGERTFVYYPGANSLLSYVDINIDVLSRTKIVHFADTFLLPRLDGEGALALLKEARSRGAKTSMDTSWDTKGRWLTLLGGCLPLIDFFFCNLSEAQAMTGYTSAEDASRALLNYGAGLVIIKMGAHGSLIRGAGLSLNIPSMCVDVVDTTGAGDCYVAAFLFGYSKEWDYERIGMFASAAGGACVRVPGATTGIYSYDHVVSLVRDNPTTV